MVHFVNIFISTLARDVGGSKESPCTWYFLNILVDTTVGVAILWYILRMLDSVCILLGVEGLRSGDYGNPPRVSWWLKQACVYTIGLLLMKLTVLLILRVIPQLGGIGSFLLRWTEYSERLRIVVVMAIFPLIMNVIQVCFYLPLMYLTSSISLLIILSRRRARRLLQMLSLLMSLPVLYMMHRLVSHPSSSIPSLLCTTFHQG